MDSNQREAKKSKGVVDWSELCIEVMQLILESFTFPDFHRARFVCRNWYKISKSCVYKYPWLIIFPEKYSGNETCKLYDPRQDKTYETKNFGTELSQSTCLASYGNWLLMMNQKLEFSILNVLSSERINLPRLKLRGKVKFRRPRNRGVVLVQGTDGGTEPICHVYIKTGTLWIDEKTKDFVVSWIYNDEYLFCYKNGGDDSWWYLEGTKCLSVAYDDREQKLYVYTCLDFIKILDFSGEKPKELVEENWHCLVPQPWERIRKRRIAVRSSGDVVVVLSLKGFPANQEERLFYVFKMNREGRKWERVESLGAEMLVFGDGLTLAASGKESDLIYFVAGDLWSPQSDAVSQSSAGVFDLKTAESGWYQFPYCSSNDRWFVPEFGKKK
ncbi:hypothetical protein AALP_AA6G064900 [Arabis alpina]|uniref:F-box domain-containing protein n=1 Tax=Arabis alpina TaxID=50452 RepID=A0A087GMH2_ARAAL|nr:hypothetical protein AALP_AA6G064900 [Arabis alpina]